MCASIWPEVSHPPLYPVVTPYTRLQHPRVSVIVIPLSPRKRGPFTSTHRQPQLLAQRHGVGVLLERTMRPWMVVWAATTLPGPCSRPAGPGVVVLS